MICDCDIKKIACHFCIFQNSSAERQSSESFDTSSRETQSEWGRGTCRSCTTVYVIKKRMDDGKSVNSRAGRGRKPVVDRDRLRDAIRETASLAGCHSRDNSLLTTACTSIDTFAIVHALLDHVDGCARPTSSATSLTLCPAQRSAETVNRLSLCRAILKYTKMTSIFLCHSHRSSGGLNKSRIITAKQSEL